MSDISAEFEVTALAVLDEFPGHTDKETGRSGEALIFNDETINEIIHRYTPSGDIDIAIQNMALTIAALQQAAGFVLSEGGE